MKPEEKETVIFKEPEEEVVSRRVQMNSDIKRRIARRGTIERVLKLRGDKGLDVIKENEEEDKVQIPNNIEIKDEDIEEKKHDEENKDNDSIKFLSSKNNQKNETKVKKIEKVIDPIPVKVAVGMFKKRKIVKDDNDEKDNSSSEEEKEAEPAEEKPKEGSEGDLRPGEFTTEELKEEENSGEKEGRKEEKEVESKTKGKEKEKEKKKKTNKDTPIKSPGEWDSFPAMPTTETSEFGFGNFNEVFSQPTPKENQSNFDPFSSPDVWDTKGNDDASTEDKPFFSGFSNDDNAQHNFADFSKKKENEKVKIEKESDKLNVEMKETSGNDEVELSRRAFKKQNRSIVVESERMSSNSLNKSKRSGNQILIPSFSQQKKGESKENQKLNNLKPTGSVINEVLTESEKQDETDEIIKDSDEKKEENQNVKNEKDILTGEILNDEKHDDSSEGISPSKDIDLSGQIFDMDMFEDISQSINDTNIEVHHSVPQNTEEADPDLKVDFLNFEKNKEDIMCHNSMTVPKNQETIDPFITAQSIIQNDEDSQVKILDDKCLKIDMSNTDILLGNLTPRVDENEPNPEKIVELKPEIETIELTQKVIINQNDIKIQGGLKEKKEVENDNKNKNEESKHIIEEDDGQDNIMRDPTPVEKTKEFSFDSKDNPVRLVVNPPQEKKPSKTDLMDNQPQQIQVNLGNVKEVKVKEKVEKKIEEKPKQEKDPFSAFDFLSESQQGTNPEDAFNFAFTPSEPQENSGIWKVDDKQTDNVFKTSKAENSQEVDELDSLINESLNSSKLEQRMLDEEVKENGLGEDDPFNTFQNVFL